MDRENTYWNNKGKYQAWNDELQKLIPPMGVAKELHIDLLRNINNCYHDHYNNGNCNWWGNKEEQFNHIRYHADDLSATAGLEDVDIKILLSRIQTHFDNADDEDFYPISYTDGEFGELGKKWEKLADIVTRYAWEVEQAK